MPAPFDSPPSLLMERGVVPATRLDLAGQALLASTALGWRAEISAPGMLGLSSESGRVAVLEEAPEDPQRLLLQLDRIHRHRHPPRFLVVLGEPSLRARLERISIDLAALGIWLHGSDGISSWENREPRWSERRVAKSLRAAAAAAFDKRHWTESEADAQQRRIELDRMLTQAGARDVERYRLLLARRPRATLALVGAIAIVFGLQALWGGVDLPPLLTRMGSLVPERVLAGEWWRLVACTFLHGGVLHVALNLVVLWVLGRSLEPIIGTPRFLFIYFASGLAGSAASSWFVASQSVGASGAIWGLLGAHAALAFYPRPLLPAALIGLARRTAATNLVLNLVNSFNPHVDAAAHVGGGLTGALILLLMALSGGLSLHGRASPPAGAWLRGAAALLSVVFAVGCVRGIIAGRPWQLDHSPQLSKVDLPGAPWRVAIPRGLTTRSASAEGTSLELGNLAYDPTVIDISWVQLSDGPSEREPRDELSMILRQLATVPDGLQQLEPPRIVKDESRPARSHVAVRYRYVSNDEVIDDRAIGIIDGTLVRVDVIAWEALPRAYEGLAERILRSFEPAAASTASLGEPSSVFHSGVSSPRRVGEGVKVRLDRSLLGRSSQPFLELGTMGAHGCLENGCLARGCLEEWSPRATPFAARVVPLLAQRVERNVVGKRFEAPEARARGQNVVDGMP
jgi:membrane associated rhomboid family serine protease